MPGAQPLPQIPGLLMRPACPKCSTPMVLTQTSPDERGFENRVFDCPKCGYSQDWVFKEL
jgi:DNA-directed RNA polymerase subunit M/transcription elongation factor TFIIS